MQPADRDWEDAPNVVETMSASTKSTKRMKKRETKFLGAREQKHTKPLAAGESNDVASHSFAGLSKKWSDFCGEVESGGPSNTDGFGPYWR